MLKKFTYLMLSYTLKQDALSKIKDFDPLK
jgi:hypothetical protein